MIDLTHIDVKLPCQILYYNGVLRLGDLDFEGCRTKCLEVTALNL